MNLREDLRGN
jgi:hypothetical protein